MNELGKPFLKKSDKQKKQKINVKMPLARTKNTSEKCQSDSHKKNRPITNYEWIGKTIWKKNPIKKIEKTVKIKVKLPHGNKKNY